MPIWPPTLPDTPLRDGYQEAEADTVIETPMEAGPPKSRPRVTAGTRAFTCVFEFTGAELAQFKTFYRDTVANGALSFDWTEPVSGATATFKFTKPVPVHTAVGGDVYRTTCALRRLP